MQLKTRQFLKFVTLAVLSFSLVFPLTALSTTPAVKLSVPHITGRFKPKPIVVVNHKTAKQASLLTKEEIDKIQTLQGAITPQILSNISPDDTKVIVKLHYPGSKKHEFYFLTITDGTQTEIDAAQLQDYQIDWFYWQDRNTAIAIASKSEDEDAKQYALLEVRLNRRKVRIEPLELPGELMSVAPDGSSLLIKTESRSTKELKQGVSQKDENDDADKDEDTPTEFRIITTHDHKELTRFAIPAGSKLASNAWTPDGTKLALVRVWESDNPSEFSWGGTSLLARQSQDVMGLLAPTDNPNLQKNALIAIDLKTGDRQTLPAGRDGELFSDVSWSPDGQTILVQMIHPLQLKGRPYPVYSYTEGSSYRFLSANLQEISRLDVPELANYEDEGFSDSQFISPKEALFTALNGMDYWLFSYDLQSGKLKRLLDEPGTYTNAIASQKSRQILFQYSSFTQPPELYRFDLEKGEMVALTQLNEDIAAANKIRADDISFTLKTGEKLDGVLIQSADAEFPPQGVPLVVWQEGGPASSMTNWWNADVENPYALLPNFDIALLVLPIYGRYGFGTERFTKLYNDRNFGQVDIDAMAEVVQQAIAKGYTSAGKVGITGCSYGGYFTLQSVIRHPQLYAAANPQCSWVDMLTDWSGADAILSPFVYGNLTPYTDLTKFQQDSPVYNAAQIQTPLLIFHGSNDRLPVTMLENIYWTIAAKGTPARFVKFMGAGHGLVKSDTGEGEPDYEVYAAQEMIQWFRQYLGAGGELRVKN